MCIRDSLSLQLLSLSMLCKNYGIIHFTIGNYTLFGVHLPSLTPQNGADTEETLCGGTFLGSKITSVRPLGVQKIVQILDRNSKHEFPKDFGHFFSSHITSASLNVDRMQKLRNHSFYNRKPHTCWCSATLFGTSKRMSGRHQIARRDLFGVQNYLCGPSLCSPGHSRASISCQ